MNIGAAQSIIYITRPDLESIQTIVAQMRLQPEAIISYILFIPRRTIECDELLEQNGLLNEERIAHVSLDLLLLDEDLLSMELPRSFANHLLDDEDSYKIYVQSSLQRIETVYGKIKYKFAKGAVAS
jgi:vacuolar protein sorting-associated protein 33A